MPALLVEARWRGPLAQLAEQVTLNHPVPGSIPGRLTTPLPGRKDAAYRSTVGEVSELVDEHDLGSCAERRRSSSLLFPTRIRALRCNEAQWAGPGGWHRLPASKALV